MTDGGRRSPRLRTVQVSFHRDEHGRDARTLLRAWPTLGGVASAVARADVDVVVVQAAARRETVRHDGVTFHFVDAANGVSIRLGDGLRTARLRDPIVDHVAALAPDLIHVHGFHHPMEVRRLTRALPRVPTLVQDHASRPPHGWRRRAWRWGFASVGGAAFTARAQAMPFFEAGVLRPGLPVFEVLEGSSVFTPGDRDAARRSTGLFGAPCLLWTGHLDANKDPLTVLEAFRLAAPDLPDARLWCCFGTAPLLAAVRRRIDGCPVLRARVALLGARPHATMEQYFRAADFFVQASHREGSGYSVIEAMACGATPLVSDIAPMRRMVGVAGSLTPVGDPAALARAMVAWAAREPVLLRRAARARFEHALSFGVIGRDLRAAYETLAASR